MYKLQMILTQVELNPFVAQVQSEGLEQRGILQRSFQWQQISFVCIESHPLPGLR